MKSVTKNCQGVLTELLRRSENECGNVWDFFLFLTEIPRASGKCAEVCSKLIKLVETNPLFTSNGVSICQEEKTGNLILRKPAAKGLENNAKICIQAHLDMVTTKTAASNFNFDTDAIQLVLKDGSDWLEANGTTLGADNGIGVAAGLALMAESDFPTGALECLFTVDEETTMFGAEFLQPTSLQSQILINVDSEEEGAICMGCAGGQEHVYSVALSKEKNEVRTCYDTKVQLKLTGLRGGHSGIDIGSGHGNAGKLLSRILADVFVHSTEEENNASNPLFKLYEFSAGNAVNAIPSYANASILIKDCDKESVERKINDIFNVIAKEYEAIEGVFDEVKKCYISSMKLGIAYEKGNLPSHYVDFQTTQQIFDIVSVVPHGVLRQSPDVPNLIESSTSMALLNLKLDMSIFEVHTFTRSSRASSLKEYDDQVRSICRLASNITSVGPMNAFPGWIPNILSPALLASEKAFEKIFKTKARVYSVHAGLETGFVVQNYPTMDCVSIGPQIENAHSTDEKMLIPSVPRFYSFLKETISTLNEVEK